MGNVFANDFQPNKACKINTDIEKRKGTTGLLTCLIFCRCGGCGQVAGHLPCIIMYREVFLAQIKPISYSKGLLPLYDQKEVALCSQGSCFCPAAISRNISPIKLIMDLGVDKETH